MFSRVSTGLHPSLEIHLKSKFCTTFRYDKKKKRYAYVPNGGNMEWHCAGLVSAIKNRYHKKYKNSKRHRVTYKKGSTSKIGITVDRQLQKVVGMDGKRPKRLHAMTRELLDWLEARGHTFQAAQVPVQVKKFYRATQADLITMNQNGDLVMWEVKTGYTPGMYTTRGKPHFNAPLQNIICTKAGIWELQRYWTARSLRESGVQIVHSYVLNIYKDTKKDQLIVKCMDNAAWCTLLDEQVEETAKVTLGKRHRN